MKYMQKLMPSKNNVVQRCNNFVKHNLLCFSKDYNLKSRSRLLMKLAAEKRRHFLVVFNSVCRRLFLKSLYFFYIVLLKSKSTNS